MLPNQFPPSQCSSYFTQWLISEYLNRINESKEESPPPPPPPPTKTPPPTPVNSHGNHHSFTAKHLKHLFTHTSKHPPTNNKPNNNEYKNGLTSPQQQSPEHEGPLPKNIEFIQLLALNALEFTAPIYSFLNKKDTQKEKKKEDKVCRCPSTRSFVQLSGHPGSFAPAGPNTVWKKMPQEDQVAAICGREQMEGKSLRVLLEGLSVNGAPPPQQTQDSTPITVFFNSDDPHTVSTSTSASSSPILTPQVFSIPTHLLPNETQVYRKVNSTVPPDPLIKIIPRYVTETIYMSTLFLELEDLLTNFSKPCLSIMDIKLGTRTFLESEVKNNKPRPDLYQKLISVDPTACTPQEHEQKAVTKLTYMLFREKQSSSQSLGFRVEGVKIAENGTYDPKNQLDDVNFKVLKQEQDIMNVFQRFCKHNVTIASKFLERLEFIRKTLEESDFFMTHEVIGSSLLFIHDDDKVGIWLIDFAKTFPVPGGRRLTHREGWELGNYETGVLTGVDSTIELFRAVVKELSELGTPL